MLKDKKLTFLTVLYLIVVVLLIPLIYTIPNKKFLNILNISDFHTASSVAIILCMVVIFLFLKISKIKKLIFTFIASLIIYSVFGIYYYLNLPKYTYDEAVAKVEHSDALLGKSVEVHQPPYREDKVGIGKESFLKTTNHLYYIYLTVDDEPVMYKFNPLNGEFELSERVRDF